MNGTLRPCWEQVVFAAAAAVAVAATSWAWSNRSQIEVWRRASAGAPPLSENYVRVEFPSPRSVAPPWLPPGTQSGGAGWVYEVFTPPVIYYHAAAGAFAVRPVPRPDQTSGAFGVELIEVRRELYKLQLVGYIGAPGDYLAAFVSPRVAETLLGRAGQRFEELGLTLAGVEVRKIDVSEDPARPAYDVAAIATLHEVESGLVVELDSRVRKFTDTPLALLRLDAVSKPQEVRAGAELRVGDATYRVERIQLDPPEVVVARLLEGLPLPERRVLKPSSLAQQSLPKPENRFREATFVRGVATSPNPH
jgi:hypothetical protein